MLVNFDGLLQTVLPYVLKFKVIAMFSSSYSIAEVTKYL